MRIPRIFEDIPLREKSEICLGEGVAHRLQHVLRLRAGAPLRVFNGGGGEYEAKLLAIEKHQARIGILRFLNISRESNLKVHLVQGIPRGEKMDYVLQKSVELGVASIAPVTTEYGVVRLGAGSAQNKIKRWQEVVVSACEQSGRNQLPTIYPPQTLTDWFTRLCPRVPVLFLHTRGNKKLKTFPIALEVVVVVGPEGGFSESETNFMQGRGYYGVNLGPRILRTETGSVAILAALQTLWGDF